MTGAARRHDKHAVRSRYFGCTGLNIANGSRKDWLHGLDGIVPASGDASYIGSVGRAPGISLASLAYSETIENVRGRLGKQIPEALRERHR